VFTGSIGSCQHALILLFPFIHLADDLQAPMLKMLDYSDGSLPVTN